MMTSVDLTGPSRTSAQHQHQQSARYASAPQMQRYASHRGASPPSSAGRTKTEQVVLEFLYKVAELIVQSRVNFQAEPDQRRGGRRARFNLDIEEVQFVRDAMAAWKEDVRLPLAVDIYWDADGQRVLLERWSVSFAAEHSSGSPTFLGSTQDVIQQLKEVCKRISVLLRALFCFMRQLPAHRLFTQSYPSSLGYKFHSAPASDATRAFETTQERVPTNSYAFIPISTPFGMLKLSAIYRIDCDQLTERQEQVAPAHLFQDNFIIQDYVPGSPDTLPATDVGSRAAPRAAQGFHDAPLAVTDLRTDSFVPVSDGGVQFGGEMEQRRRRSTPRYIPSTTMPSAQFSSTGPIQERRTDPPELSQPTQSISKPMAIPQSHAKPVAAGKIATTSNTGYGETQDDAKLMQHAHSYGGEHDVRMRGAVANPNVAAAPYGYGNVAIEREQRVEHHTPPSSTGFQQQLWQGGSGTGGVSSGSHNGSTSGQSPHSLHDEVSGGAYHPLATPPRHPKTSSLLRSSHRSPAALHKAPLPAANELHPARSSLDNFSLDGGASPSPAPLQPLGASKRRKNSFNGAFLSDGGSSDDAQTLGVTTAMSATKPKSEAMAIQPRAGVEASASSAGLPVFSCSPPFHANPCELLSTSPGYPYGKNYLRRSGSSDTPTFITTDRFQPGTKTDSGSGASFSASTGLLSTKPRGFASEFSDSGVAAWGVSPDTPDAFDLAVAGPDTNADSDARAGGRRPPFLSSSEDDEGDELLLPFALGGVSADGSSATTAVGSSGDTGLSGASWETASVGNFLQQLKQAPRLGGRSSSRRAATEINTQPHADDHNASTNTSDDQQSAAALFDDELADFRSLRDELARVL